MDFLRQLGERHERLKERVHAFRIPLSPAGQRFMGFVYFTIPVIGGYFLMQSVIARAEVNLGKQGERLSKSSQDTNEQNKALQTLLSNMNKQQQQQQQQQK